MAVRFASGLTLREFQWTVWKARLANAAGHQYEEQDGTYLLWFYDGPEVNTCRIWQGTVPSDILGSYSQEQNDADKAAFEGGIKALANGFIDARTLDGRDVVRVSCASRARNFNLIVFSLIPGNSTSAKCFNQDLSANTRVTVTCYDANNAVTTDVNAAVKTHVDYEPTFNYEAIGGWIDIPPSLVGSTPCLYYVCATGVPDVPSAYGGSIPFVAPTDIALIYTNKVVSDGRASQCLTYNATYHTNKMRWTFWHPTGTHPRIQIYLETFAE